MAEISILLFGRISVLVDGKEWIWERRKTQALIVYLATSLQSYSRDTLATLLWPESDTNRARANLRRVLANINKSPLGAYLIVDRQNLQFRRDEYLFIDVLHFEKLASNKDDLESLNEAANLYIGPFLTGFSLKDSILFDDWQAEKTQYYEQIALSVLEQLARIYIDRQNFELAQNRLQQLRILNAYHEGAVKVLLEVYQHLGLRHAAVTLFEGYSKVLAEDLELSPSEELLEVYEAFKNGSSVKQQSPKNVLPPTPSLVIGREKILEEFKTYLQSHSRLVMQGWPGIGKTTLSSLLAHDKQLNQKYPDAVLWASLGENPDLLAVLHSWGEATGCGGILQTKSIEGAASKLSSHLHNKQILFIIDDVWQLEHGQSLLLGGAKSASLLTSRFNDIAYHLCKTPDNLFKIPILSIDDSMELLNQLAPDVIKTYPSECLALVRDLEGLPLALQVAGRLLYSESTMGWSVVDLLKELRETSSLLKAQAPSDRMDISSQTTPTIAALLERSVKHLSEQLQERYVLLSVFAPKPATFSYDAIEAVWESDDTKESLRTLVNRGLLEPLGQSRFQMHALLVMLARSMVEESHVK